MGIVHAHRGRLTLALAVVALTVLAAAVAFAVLAAVTGEISWMQAAAIILGGGSVFAGVEGARDIATRRG